MTKMLIHAEDRSCQIVDSPNDANSLILQRITPEINKPFNTQLTRLIPRRHWG